MVSLGVDNIPCYPGIWTLIVGIAARQTFNCPDSLIDDPRRHPDIISELYLPRKQNCPVWGLWVEENFGIYHSKWENPELLCVRYIHFPKHETRYVIRVYALNSIKYFSVPPIKVKQSITNNNITNEMYKSWFIENYKNSKLNFYSWFLKLNNSFKSEEIKWPLVRAWQRV